MALRFDRAAEKQVAAALEENKVPFNGIHAI
jgi:hypothetical protein